MTGGATESASQGAPMATTEHALTTDFDRAGTPPRAADRPVRARHHLSARLGDGPLRFPLRLLHVGTHDLPAEGRPADAGGARPAVQRLRRQGRHQAAPDRRRATGAARHHDPGRLAVAPPQERRAQGTDAHDQRLAAREIRRRAEGPRRRTHQRLDRHARSGQVPRDHALGRSRQGARRHRCRAEGRPARSRSTRWRSRASTRTNSPT